MSSALASGTRDTSPRPTATSAKTEAVAKVATSSTGLARSPQIKAPTAWQPVKIMVQIAIPRAITHRGRNSCSSATRVEIVGVHDRPAATKITNAAGSLGMKARDSSDARSNRPAAARVALVDSTADPAEQQCSGDGSDAEGGEHQPVAAWSDTQP